MKAMSHPLILWPMYPEREFERLCTVSNAPEQPPLSVSELLAAYEKMKDIEPLYDLAASPSREAWLRNLIRPAPTPAPLLPSIFSTRVFTLERVPENEIWYVTPDPEAPDGLKVVKILRLLPE